MQEFIKLSRAVAAEFAAEFRNDPRGELAAWFYVALEREGMVASLYQRQSVESRLQSLPKRLVRSVIAKVNGVCANEERHVALIRALVAADSAWPHVAFKETWGRLQGIVLNQLAGTNALAHAIALILLELGARSSRERAAARTVAGLDAGEFLRFSRTLETTAVESYQRVVALLAALPRPKEESLERVALHLKMLGILRDERVHRDVFHVLYRAFGGAGAPPPDSRNSGTTELPDSITARPIASPADLNGVCRAILVFHYGAALPSGASRLPRVRRDEALRVAADYWRWQMEDPHRKSYLVECQRQDVFLPEGDILLLGTAGLATVVQGIPSIRSHPLNHRLIARFMVEDPAGVPRAHAGGLSSARSRTKTRGTTAASAACERGAALFSAAVRQRDADHGRK